MSCPRCRFAMSVLLNVTEYEAAERKSCRLPPPQGSTSFFLKHVSLCDLICHLYYTALYKNHFRKRVFKGKSLLQVQIHSVDVFFLSLPCLQAERQGEEEPTKPFSHQVRLS